MKDLPHFLRPREKLLEHGPEALSDQELLALIIRSGVVGRSALNLAETVLPENSIHKLLADTSVIKHSSAGPSIQASLLALAELCKRYKSDIPRSRVLSKEDALVHLHEFRHLNKEHFIALYLNARYELIHTEIVSIGTLDASLVHPRDVFAPAFRHHAAHILVAHNHPSNTAEPSHADVLLTRRLVEAGELLHVPIIDHIILTASSALSMRETGTL